MGTTANIALYTNAREYNVLNATILICDKNLEYCADLYIVKEFNRGRR